MARDIDDMFFKEMVRTDRAIPGESWTTDPEVDMPFTTPPEFTKKSDILEYYFEKFTSENVYNPLMDAIETGVPLMDIAKTILLKDFEDGKFTPDLLLLIIEPVVFMLASLAERMEIDFVIQTDRDDPEMATSLGTLGKDIEDPEMGEEFPEEVQGQLESEEPLPVEGQSLLGVR